jgi:hypothetical protein
LVVCGAPSRQSGGRLCRSADMVEKIGVLRNTEQQAGEAVRRDAAE